MIYQLAWKILPGLRGLSCSEFSAQAANSPDTERGVAFECGSDAERNEFLRELEEYFGPKRYSNSASAFETVKLYVAERMAKRA